MLKIPMQIYLDPETVVFYKNLARKKRSTFAGTIRYVLEKERQEEKERGKKSKKSTIESPSQKFLKNVKEAQVILKDQPYHSPELTNDELLYGKYE